MSGATRMNFSPTETQQMLVNSLVRVLADNYTFQGRARHLRGGDQEHLWPAFAELGLLGIEVHEYFGGSGGTFDDLAVALVPIGAALVVEPLIPSAVVATGLLSTLGTDTQKARWLPRIVDGTLKACLAHSERRARDMMSWVEATASRAATGWRLNGAKIVALGGHSADLFLVSARTAGRPDAKAGLSLFLVPSGSTGLYVKNLRLYDGSGAADLTLASVTLPDAALLGHLNQAYDWVDLAQDRGAAAVCAEAIGVMTALYELTLSHLKSREQFGQPIGTFQILQHRMADVYMAIELVRPMALYAIAAVSDSDQTGRARKISAAKVAIGRACREVGQSCIQLHGGIGLTDEYPAGHYFKRLTMIERLFGDTAHHLKRYAGVSG